MPRVFFDFDGGDRHYEDTEGTELVDLTMVRSEATRFLATTFKDTPADTGNRRICRSRSRYARPGHIYDNADLAGKLDRDRRHGSDRRAAVGRLCRRG
jgi:hypothetical protein